MATPVLITIPFSHFCEKARWALDRAGIAYEEDGHLPLFHWGAVRRAGGKRTVPVLRRAGEALIADSTAIVAWADARAPGTLLPVDAGARSEAIAVEDQLDVELGPASRRWAYFQLMPRKDLDHLLEQGVPRWQVRAFKLARPLAVAMLRRGMAIDAAGVERSRAKIESAFARVNERLRDGRRFLAGDRFSVADLTLAALAAPILMPKHNYPVALPQPELLAAAARDQVERWRDTAAGRHAMLMYETERARRA